jgi:hypothetical protein
MGRIRARGSKTFAVGADPFLDHTHGSREPAGCVQFHDGEVDDEPRWALPRVLRDVLAHEIRTDYRLLLRCRLKDACRLLRGQNETLATKEATDEGNASV